MKAIILQNPPAWVNRRYYEIRNRPVKKPESIRFTYKDAIEVIFGAIIAYLFIVVLAVM